MTDTQALAITRLARYLLTDIEAELNVHSSAAQEERVIKFITDAFASAADIYLHARYQECSLCHALVSDLLAHHCQTFKQAAGT
jgi:hypothetical protein